MSDQKNMGKGFLKEKLGDYLVDPPEKVWDSIASQLGGRRRRSLIIITLATAATIALAITFGLNYFGPELPDESGIAETTGSREDQVSETDSREDQASEIDSREDHISETKPERERATLDAKVIKTMAEIADEPSSEPLEKAMQSIAMAEITQEMEISDSQKPEEISDETTVDDTLDPSEVSLDPPVDLTLDPEGEIISDPIPDFQEEQKREPKWIVGAALSPLYSFRDAQASAMASAAEFESGMVAYAAGVHVSYRTASRLSIETGVFFNKMGVSIGAPGIQLFNRSFDFSPMSQEANQTNVTTITNSVGNIVARSGDVFVNNYKLNAMGEANAYTNTADINVFDAEDGIHQHLDYIELPFNLRYTVVDRDIELQLVGGMSTNFLVNNYVTMETAEGPTEIGYMTNIRSVNYSGNAGLGMIYHMHKQISLHLEPRFRYFLNSVNDATLPSTRPFAFGLYTGLSYTF